jgi:dUTP pyrophosphatase
VGLKVFVKVNSGGSLPDYASAESAGADLFACPENEITLKPGEREIVPTGIRIHIPVGFEGQVRPRSGLAFKYGITVLNAPGTIDSDYRGEVKVILINLGKEPYTIKPGDRIAQLVIAPVTRAEYEPASSLETSSRGENGFGSTGL